MKRLALVVLTVLLGACQSTPYDYGPLIEHMPRSIVVLPPLDETPEVDACYGWLSTITRPLADQGYYVFPVALVDRIMRENGLPTPGEMHQVSLSKLSEVFGADAVLYVTVKEWGTSYRVLASVTTVHVTARLVDLATGSQIWAGQSRVRRNPNDNQNGLLGMLIGALVNQVATSIADPTVDVARDANSSLVGNSSHGLLYGPRHPQHEEQLRELRERRGR